MKKTVLNETHKHQYAKMLEFAGYDMPIQYKEGMLKEPLWVREGGVGIFDVSHMGQFFMTVKNSDQANSIASFLSYITPSDFSNIKDGVAKYTVLVNENGGIIDDLIITKMSDEKFFIVLNAGCKEKDEKWILSHLPSHLTLQPLTERSLIAIQGAKSQEILQKFLPKADLSILSYMNLISTEDKYGYNALVSRTGYTGEDGFEISVENKVAVNFWQELSSFAEVMPIGLGARDSLRLEMGYPLYGHDLNEETTPIEASLNWVVSKNSTNFIGKERLDKDKSLGINRKRVGIKILDKGIAREGAEVFFQDKKIGTLTSGGYSPTLKTSIGQAYLEKQFSYVGNDVKVMVRDKMLNAIVTEIPFIPARTKNNKVKSL